MGLQTAKREERFPIPVVQKLFPVTKTVAGFEGARFVTAVSGADAVAAIPGSYALSTNASVGISMGGVYYAGVGEYDPDFVASVLGLIYGR